MNDRLRVGPKASSRPFRSDAVIVPEVNINAGVEAIKIGGPSSKNLFIAADIDSSVIWS